jgi:SpoVK/Ycf46/Vps4 family AAA+-type ATPase
MMTTRQILALLNSHIEGDEEQFFSVALQIAAQQAREGKPDDAEKLKRLVQKARDQRRLGAPAGGQTPIPLARPRAELQGLVESTYPKTTLSSMVLADDVRNRLARVVRQQQERATLRGFGQKPATHMLLVGPPGTGKTMTASALAGELRLPLFTVRLESLFSRYFGETAAKMRVLFDQIAQTRGVYLLDEFDAIGARRGDPNDVGEIRRVLNSFLQFLEQDESDSLIIAATNHPQLLDRAVFRRFDMAIHYALPSQTAAETVMKGRLALLDTAQVEWPTVVAAAEGLSHAEIARACEQAAKNVILDHRTAIDTGALVATLDERRATDA